MTKRTMWMVQVLVIVLLFGGCSPQSRYEQRLEKELASGIRYDSLFLGLHLGMSDQEFYTLCWELNRDGIIRQSHSNTSVEYDPGDFLEFPATMTFYPKFIDGKISEMPVQFSYDGWAPWNKDLYSGPLTEDIKRWYEEVYGPGFIRVTHPVRGIAYTKIDGNRRITIFQEDELYAWAIFTDMTSENPAESEISAESQEQAHEEPAE